MENKALAIVLLGIEIVEAAAIIYLYREMRITTSEPEA